MTRPTADGNANASVSTDADMTVVNDNRDGPIDVQVASDNMSDSFPPGQIAAANSRTSYVSASAWPGQSHFDLEFTYNTSQPIRATYSVDIGQGLYSTRVKDSTSSPLGSSGVVLAPGPPVTAEIDYKFYFFCGPAILTPVIQGVIRANLPALIEYVRNHPIRLTLSHGVEVEIKDIPNQLSCSYAAVTGANNNFKFNIVLNLTGSVGGKMSLVDVASGDFGATFTNLSALISISVDTSNEPSLRVEVTQLQISMDDYSLTGVIWDILKVFPLIAAILAFATAYRVAGAINNNFNSQILALINDAIRKYLPSDAADETVASSKAAFPPENERTDCGDMKGEGADGDRKGDWNVTKELGKNAGQVAGNDRSAWMSKYQDRTLGHLVLPGTHDSAAYGLVNELSLMKYSDISFLWNFNFTDPTPTTGQNPFVPPIYTGPVAGSYVLDCVNRVAKAQGNNILQQLRDGIRYFDLRIYYDPADQRCYSQHGLKGPALDDIIIQVVQFLPQASTELIILAISHTNFADFVQPNGSSPAITSASASLSKIPVQNLYMPSDAKGVPYYDLNKLAPNPLATIIGGTGSKVMVLNVVDAPGTTASQAIFPDIAINTPGYVGAGPGEKPWPTGLTVVGNAHALQTNDIVTNIAQGLMRTTGKPNALEDFATVNNTYNSADRQHSPLGNFVDACGGPFNVFSFDWYESYDSQYATATPVDFIISLNDVKG